MEIWNFSAAVFQFLFSSFPVTERLLSCSRGQAQFRVYHSCSDDFLMSERHAWLHELHLGSFSGSFSGRSSLGRQVLRVRALILKTQMELHSCNPFNDFVGTYFPLRNKRRGWFTVFYFLSRTWTGRTF